MKYSQSNLSVDRELCHKESRGIGRVNRELSHVVGRGGIRGSHSWR